MAPKIFYSSNKNCWSLITSSLILCAEGTLSSGISRVKDLGLKDYCPSGRMFGSALYVAIAMRECRWNISNWGKGYSSWGMRWWLCGRGGTGWKGKWRRGTTSSLSSTIRSKNCSTTLISTLSERNTSRASSIPGKQCLLNWIIVAILS